jgi:hypothetical protein
LFPSPPTFPQSLSRFCAHYLQAVQHDHALLLGVLSFLLRFKTEYVSTLRDVMLCHVALATKTVASEAAREGPACPIMPRTRLRPDMVASSVSAWLPFVLAAGKPVGPIGRSSSFYREPAGMPAGGAFVWLGVDIRSI